MALSKEKLSQIQKMMSQWNNSLNKNLAFDPPKQAIEEGLLAAAKKEEETLNRRRYIAFCHILVEIINRKFCPKDCSKDILFRTIFYMRKYMTKAERYESEDAPTQKFYPLFLEYLEWEKHYGDKDVRLARKTGRPKKNNQSQTAD